MTMLAMLAGLCLGYLGKCPRASQVPSGHDIDIIEKA